MNISPILILFVTVVLNRTKVFSFNIEYRNPVVKKAELLDSYFGFSVAQHAVREGSTKQEDYWILVGAPLGKNLQPGTNRSGALFKCPVTYAQQDCVQIETDGQRFNDFDYEESVNLREAPVLLRPGPDEIKEDQWLGVTVKSQKPGGKVVVCAHRYIQSPNLTLYHYGKGLCYLLSNELAAEQALEPCKGRPMEKLHQQYGFCQVGTSLAVLGDGFTLMGSPGPYTWRGTIFAQSVEGGFLEKDKTIYKGPLNDNPTPINKYSYLGMSVTGGHFLTKDYINYVSGAPRSNFTGQVFFFNKTKSVDELGILLIINGTQFASSFGYEILAVDIDQDGYDELLVAAPFYFEGKTGGAVYIYSNLRHCTPTNCKPSAVLTGKPESRFGFSMTSLGDINRDGFTDVAIGAPYENGGGAVYIYLGLNNSLSPDPSQAIRHRGLKTLGYSMSGGLDMDLNEYPDLLVGAYESDRVILYKTRPIVDIGITVDGEELKNINVSRRGCRGDAETNKTCFTFKTCFTLSKFRLTDPVDVKYELKELTKRVPRVTFADQHTTNLFKVFDNSREYCKEEVAYLVEGNGDILTPIKFQVNYTMYNDSINSPILNKTSIKLFEATFQKNCGDDDICYSNLVMNAGTFLNKTDEGYRLDMGKNKEFLLDVNVTNFGEPAYEAKLFVMHPEGPSYVALQTEKNKTSTTICTSNNESTIVTCNLGNPLPGNQAIQLRLRFEITDTKKQQLDFEIFVNSTSRELSKQTSQSMKVILKKTASFAIKGEGRPSNIFYAGEVKGQSAMKNLEDIGQRVIHSYDVINQGEWNIRDMIVTIQWPYQVYTKRKEGGKWLLYLEKIPMKGCTVNPPKIVNPLQLNSTGQLEEEMDVEEPPTRTRRKRDANEVVKSETVKGTDGKERKIVTMGCVKQTALCATIRCQIPQLPANSQLKINITARVWESTLIEDYTQVDWVSLISVAQVNIQDPTVLLSDNTVSIADIETQAYPPVISADSGVNIWIIVGSVLAGLFLLIVVIIVLYKCGFFKRNRVKDRTLSANLKKQGESENLLKENEAKPPKRS